MFPKSSSYSQNPYDFQKKLKKTGSGELGQVSPSYCQKPILPRVTPSRPAENVRNETFPFHRPPKVRVNEAKYGQNQE